ncbi:MAG: Smr/MutS family protein [Gemmatimonadaceae bacterium]|nr:Smr/MutS family protein [Gemmatimonadaceae bacterium]
MSTYHRRRLVELKHAYDEARFGADRTLNLRAQLPTAAEASRRADAWLRERQASGAREVLVITGRGNRSENGLSVVRESVAKTLRTLRRVGVVDTIAEHTPGSFVVTLAPMRRLWESARRAAPAGNDRTARATPTLGLDPSTLAMLRDLAERSLDALGIRDREVFLEREMATQLSLLVRAVPDGPDRELRLRDVIRRALEEDDSRTR